MIERTYACKDTKANKSVKRMSKFMGESNVPSTLLGNVI